MLSLNNSNDHDMLLEDNVWLINSYLTSLSWGPAIIITTIKRGAYNKNIMNDMAAPYIKHCYYGIYAVLFSAFTV